MSGLIRQGVCVATMNALLRREYTMTIESQARDLLFDVSGGVARITINRPEARNACTFEMYEKLAQACEAVNADDSVRVLILTGAGEKAFSAGTDIAVFKDFKTPEDALGYESFMDRIMAAIENCRVPTIAVIAGACTGGGAALAACCDLRIATEDSKFGFPIARTLVNCLSTTNLARLAGLIGASRVKDMIFTSRLFDAKEALEIGFLNGLAKDRMALDRNVAGLAAQMASIAPLTLRATKEGFRRIQARQRQEQDDDLVLMCYMSDDFREGMAAFLEKRTPQWKGR